jgi:hypothetical protein
VVDFCDIHSLLPLATSDQVQGVRYSKSEVETDMSTLELETDAATLKLETDAGDLKLETDAYALDLEMETDVSQEISKQEWYSID